jgi:predicted nucleic acid-binding protein
MTRGLCFTTVLNASELIFKIEQKSMVVDLLNALKVLGIHPKYALGVDKYKNLFKSLDDAIFCATAEYNQLPVVTIDKEKYISTGLKILTPRDVYETL